MHWKKREPFLAPSLRAHALACEEWSLAADTPLDTHDVLAD